MNLTEFQTLSKRTMPFGGEPANQVEFENMLGNYAMGLVGEAIEVMVTYQNMSISNVTHEELAKELGDVAHYAVGLSTILGIELPNEYEIGNYSKIFSIEHIVSDLVGEAGLVVEHAKKVIYHRHEIDKRDMKIRLEEIFKLLSDISADEGYDLSEIYEMNIEKLKTRYPDKFSVEDSIARVDTK